MRKIKYILRAAIASAALVVGLGIPALVSASPAPKTDVCHKTNSKSNPFVVQQVNANQLQSHLSNGDFIYNGPLKTNGHPDQKTGSEWCENNQPGDKCANVAGKQDAVPAGQVVDANGNCVVPVATSGSHVLGAQVTVAPVGGVNAGAGGAVKTSAETIGLVGSIGLMVVGAFLRKRAL